jgi:hypothetical protein
MKTSVKITLLLVFALLLAVASFQIERRTVHSLVPGGETRTIDPLEYTELASFDGFLFKDGNLYDVYSLTPKSLQEKDCPT